MPAVFNFQYRFHSAGQGIFASGTIRELEGQVPFHWVVDCGSTARKSVLQPVVERYRDFVVNDHLDLLCISHFDKDHVNGLTDLLKGLHVETVVLPYYSPLERLLLGARSAPDDNEFREFLGNPVAFLLERAASIGQIIIVGGTPPEEDLGVTIPDRPPTVGGNAPPPDRPTYPDGWRFKPESQHTGDASALVDGATLGLAKQLNTRIVFSPSPLRCLALPPTSSGYWEFLFFHKPIANSVLQSIRAGVARVVKLRGHRNITAALSSSTTRKRIKEQYVSAIGEDDDTTDDINSTSLCVYSGPELTHFVGGSISDPWPNALIGSSRATQYGPGMWFDNCSILYTGDANLSTSDSRNELHAFLTTSRRERIGVLQVPHHGSRNNWEAGASQEFHHHSSVFCVDEHHVKFKHPHREVVLDLMHHGPVLANKSLGWNWRGRAYFS